jgi:hypothetical protein
MDTIAPYDGRVDLVATGAERGQATVALLVRRGFLSK